MPKTIPEIKKFSLKLAAPHNKKTISKKSFLLNCSLLIKKYKTSVVINWGKIKNFAPDTKKRITGDPKIKKINNIFLCLSTIILEI